MKRTFLLRQTLSLGLLNCIEVEFRTIRDSAYLTLMVAVFLESAELAECGLPAISYGCTIT